MAAYRRANEETATRRLSDRSGWRRLSWWPGDVKEQAAQAQDNGPANTRTPEGAVRAFLNALQAKDKDRLAEATALRAQNEASTR